MTVLQSYVGGEWTAPADEGRPVLDAVLQSDLAEPGFGTKLTRVA